MKSFSFLQCEPTLWLCNNFYYVIFFAKLEWSMHLYLLTYYYLELSEQMKSPNNIIEWNMLITNKLKIRLTRKLTKLSWWNFLRNRIISPNDRVINLPIYTTPKHNMFLKYLHRPLIINSCFRTANDTTRIDLLYKL